ncbi:MAG: hypothetical protein J0G96_13505 [Flavobacteriia bacterium]|nr:hypothetical protein [Flavobacteriia bacterium]OJX39613.1 MAG: hypothetical protein BGO87_11785 [Flavobacteriia bacterium 40-80]
MKLIWNFFLFILKILNWWFFKIPGRFSFFALVGYNLLIYFCFGRWSIEAVEESLGSDSFKYFLFLLFIAFPMFWSFICCWSGAKMTSSQFSKNNTSVLDRAIDYRNGQIGVQTPKQAFETMKKTAVLDQMKANEGSKAFDKAMQGFNAQYGNKPPQAIFEKLTGKDGSL